MTDRLNGPGWRAQLAADGCIGFIETTLYGEPRRLDFRSDVYAGPRWYGEWDGLFRSVALAEAGGLGLEGVCDGLHFGIEYAGGDALAIIARLRNDRTTPFRPVKAGLRLGLDTCMETYPDWNGKLFPTLLRCERTHFWGYCMSPEGTLLVIASPNPVASWSLNYNRASYGDYGHRIYTLNLDLMNALPLPPRHPHLDELWPGEERVWHILLKPVTDLAQVKPVASALCGAPMVDIDRLVLLPGECATVSIFSSGPAKVTLTNPAGEKCDLAPSGPEGRYSVNTTAHDLCGLYALRAAGPDHKTSEALLFLRRPWSWYMKQARSESLRIPQKASTHNESWMGLYTQMLARRRFPDAVLDARAEAVFHDIVPRMFDTAKGEPIYVKTRVQNIAYMAGLYAARYRCTGHLKDLEAAARFCDYVLRFQAPSGALLGNAGRGLAEVHYTCVGYPVKSILEVCIEEKNLAADPVWAERCARHWAGAKGAMDDLVRQKDNISTEGEITFEDGMISCSAAQLAFFALLQDDPAERRRYAEAAEYILRRHRCLQQILIPDCRMNGGTLRFWEAQYDVLLLPNMMNSPHGWTSWKTYATWYLYLLTGKEEYLVQTMNTLGACVQVIDADTGRLRWGFVPDPYVRAEQFGTRTHWRMDLVPERVFIEDPARPGCREAAHPVIGEQYVGMISDVYPGWCCDNDVHEHFKCLDETILAAACVLERECGELSAWNCRVEDKDGRLLVVPAERAVESIHFNLRRPRRVIVRFDAEEQSAILNPGLQWIHSARRVR